MASLTNAPADEIEEELLFHHVLIASLDPEADDYNTRLAELTAKQEELEAALIRCQTAQNHGHPQLNTPNRQRHAEPGSSGRVRWRSPGNSSNTSSDGTNEELLSDSYMRPQQGTKRAIPTPLRSHDERPAKRRTPEPRNDGIPWPVGGTAGSKQVPDRRMWDPEGRLAFQRQKEDALWRQQEELRKDEEIARQLSQGQARSMTPTSSSRPSVQTTIGNTGRYERPLPSSWSSSSAVQPLPKLPQPNGSSRQPHVKNEFGSIPAPSALHQGPPGLANRSAEVVDLTGDSDEDVGRSVTSMPTHPATHRPQQPPSASATNDVNSGRYLFAPHNVAYHGVPNANGAPSHDPHWWPVPTLEQPFKSAVSGIKTAAGYLGNELTELGNLIASGGSSSRPYEVWDDEEDDGEEDEDTDVFLTGSRSRYPDLYPDSHPGPSMYAGQTDLYRSRYDEIAHSDPARTMEEINALLENIRPDEDLPEHLRVQTPESLSVRLHKYQEVGLTWLQNCEDGSNKGGILADDMGLGKTIQMLSLLATHKSDDPTCKTTLIIAPVALMRQWKQEINDKLKRGPSHSLTVFVHHGPAKKKHFRDLQHFDVVLTTFGSIATEVKKLESYMFRKRLDPSVRPSAKEQCVLLGEDAKWYRCVLDEAQCIRNRDTLTSRAACLINAKYRFCMTGTPMMNNLGELYSLLKFLRIPPYDQWNKFQMEFIRPLKSSSDNFRDPAMRKLQTLCKAVMLRRTKKSTFEGHPILILPERTMENANPEFSTDERSFYDAIENRTQVEFNRYLQKGTVGKKYTAILVILLRLRQACCHPHLIKDFGVSAAADVTPDQIMQYASELNEAAVARIKETGGNFECPVCYDATPNPAIFLPCGHDTCAECLAKIADPANAVRNGDENGIVRCPSCRGNINPKRVTDFNAFKAIHMPELLLTEGLMPAKEESQDSETESDEDDSDYDSDDDVDTKGNLKGFIVNDNDEETDDASEAEEDNAIKDEDEKEELLPTSSKKSAKSMDKDRKKKKKKKGNGKGKEPAKKQAKAVTLAELKKLSTRNAKAKKKYLRRLRKDWISSAKIDKTLELLQQIMNDPEGEKVLIFSQWTSLLDLLEVPIDDEGWGYRRYDGSMSTRMRDDAVDDFRDPGKNVRIMLVSLKAGNAGLNLNMASQVIILDPFWNPYIEEQAIDRAHRIGQTRPVKVHRVLIKETVEDRIITLQEKKRELIGAALDEKASQSIGRLGVQELAYLFGVTRNVNDRVNYQGL